MLLRNVKRCNPPWFWHVPKSIYDLGTRQNHWKTQCFRSSPSPRSRTSTTFMRKGTGCREWCCFLYYFVGWFSLRFCSNVGPDCEKAQPSMVLACSQVHIWTWYTPKPWENRVFSWLACTTLDNQSDFHAKVDWLSRMVLCVYYFVGSFSTQQSLNKHTWNVHLAPVGQYIEASQLGPAECAERLNNKNNHNNNI